MDIATALDSVTESDMRNWSDAQRERAGESVRQFLDRWERAFSDLARIEAGIAAIRAQG